MLATHAIKAHVAATKWRWFGRRKIWFVYGTGQTVVVTMRTNGMPVEIGGEALLVDVAGERNDVGFRAVKPRRFYLNFEQHGLEPEGYYAVWLGSKGFTEEQHNDFECMSQMVDDWFTTADDVDLNLLRIQVGGAFRIDNDLVTRL